MTANTSLQTLHNLFSSLSAGNAASMKGLGLKKSELGLTFGQNTALQHSLKQFANNPFTAARHDQAGSFQQHLHGALHQRHESHASKSSLASSKPEMPQHAQEASSAHASSGSAKKTATSEAGSGEGLVHKAETTPSATQSDRLEASSSQSTPKASVHKNESREAMGEDIAEEDQTAKVKQAEQDVLALMSVLGVQEASAETSASELSGQEDALTATDGDMSDAAPAAQTMWNTLPPQVQALLNEIYTTAASQGEISQNTLQELAAELSSSAVELNTPQTGENVLNPLSSGSPLETADLAEASIVEFSEILNTPVTRPSEATPEENMLSVSSVSEEAQQLAEALPPLEVATALNPAGKNKSGIPIDIQALGVANSSETSPGIPELSALLNAGSAETTENPQVATRTVAEDPVEAASFVSVLNQAVSEGQQSAIEGSTLPSGELSAEELQQNPESQGLPEERTGPINTSAMKAGADISATFEAVSETGNTNTPGVTGVSAVTAAGVNATSTVSQTPSVNRAMQASGLNAVAQQVEDGTLEIIQSSQSEMQLKLNPNDLGSVRINLNRLSDGVFSARMIVENADTHLSLKDQIQQLQQSMMDKGIHLEKIQVVMAGESASADFSSGQNPENPSEQADQFKQQQQAGQQNPDSDQAFQQFQHLAAQQHAQSIRGRYGQPQSASNASASSQSNMAAPSLEEASSGIHRPHELGSVSVRA